MPILILFFASALTHFLFFGYPYSVVFDEVHIGNFITHYWNGTYFFDVHPPLAKLLFAGLGYLLGSSKDIVDWSTIGDTLTPELVLLRIIPVIAGTLLPLIIYSISRKLGLSKISSFSAGALVILENSLLVQSRFLLTDIVMLFFGFASIWAYLAESETNSGKKRSFLLLTSVLASAAAVSIKWTGLAFLVIIVLVELYSQWKKGRQNKIALRPTLAKVALFGTSYLVVAFFVYSALFALHISLLPKSGPGDPFMSPEFQKNLSGSTFANDPNVQEIGMAERIIELNEKMFEASAGLNTPHQYSSKWYTWPLMVRPIFYWQGTTTDNTQNSYIYFLGNPLIYWAGTAAIISLTGILLHSLIRRRRPGIKEAVPNDTALFFVITGFLINFLPFIFIGRVMFLYHYEAALVMGILAVAYLIETFPGESRNKFAAGILIAAALCFIFFSPLTYGGHLSDRELGWRMWLPTWR